MPLPENHDKPSSRHHVVDHRFAALLTEDFGIPAATVLDALEGEPKKAAIAMCGWAVKTDDPAFALASWAKKHNKGRCRRASRPAGTPQRRHGERREDTREQQDERRRGTPPGRPGGITPASVRANLQKMEG